jgi:hypothetical protein
MRPFSLIVNRIWPREVTAAIRLMRYRPRELETGFPLPAPGATRIVIRARMPENLVRFSALGSCKSFWSSQVFPSVRISVSPRSADGCDDKRCSELCLHDLISLVAGSCFANSARVATASKRDSNCMRRPCTGAECLAGHNSQTASSLMIRNVVELRFRKASQQPRYRNVADRVRGARRPAHTICLAAGRILVQLPRTSRPLI